MTYKEDREETRRDFVKLAVDALAVDAIKYLDDFSDNKEYQKHLSNLKYSLLATEYCLYLERNNLSITQIKEKEL